MVAGLILDYLAAESMMYRYKEASVGVGRWTERGESVPDFLRKLLLAMVLLCAGPTGTALAQTTGQTNLRYENWEEASAQAQKSGKPVYVYVWEYPRMSREDWARVREHNACYQMGQSTLANQQVKSLLRDYVLCALEVHVPPNRQFIHKHAPGLLPDADEEQAGFSAYRLPFHLFFDSSGKKVFQVYGYIPTQWFVQTLEAVQLLIKGQGAENDKLKQARAYARLGHICLELELHEEAKKHLERTRQLDPDNKTGAKADAELDLTIISIPDVPAKAYRALESYLDDHPNSARRTEVRYFLAVAQYWAGDESRAIRILEQIERIREPGSVEERRWIEHAVVLLQQLQVQ